MGLPDREDVRERPISMFANPRSDGDSAWRTMLWLVLACVVVLFLLYKSFLWWEARPKTAVGSPATEVITRHGMGSTDTTHADRADAANPPGASQPMDNNTHTVTKCVVSGKVIFTDGECPSGSHKSSVKVNTANVGTVAPRMPAYTPATAQPQLVEVQTPSPGTTNHLPTRNAECTYLDEQIKQIDALARQALSASSQDRLRQERQRVRSRQFELHC
ncbi:hypothetical protein [Rhodoferax sp. BLA1]|uniref:hypothetical protein n=1 Tax=Rhodoferax sp. BLA1 TaxID=2576062 RepID=UPI0015D152D9|nr:hypothetical protein [Rhodoferax sp. BLA1]